MYFIKVTATNIYSAVFPSENPRGRLADFRFAHPHLTKVMKLRLTGLHPNFYLRKKLRLIPDVKLNWRENFLD